MRSTLVLAVCWTVLASACSKGTLPAFGSAQEVTQALSEQGIVCAGLQVSKANLLRESARCEVGDARTSIFIFETSDQRDEWLSFGNRYSNDLIIGPNWAIDPPGGQKDRLEDALTGG